MPLAPRASSVMLEQAQQPVRVEFVERKREGHRETVHYIFF